MHHHDMYGDTTSPVQNGDQVRKRYAWKDFDKLLLPHGCRIVVEDYCAGYFTQKASLLERWVMKTLGLRRCGVLSMFIDCVII